MARPWVILAFRLTLALVAGSEIEFSNSPDVIQENLTKEMKMRCSLNDTASSFNGGLIGKRAVTQTAGNVKHVTSIVIMRNNGDHVATVSNFAAAQALLDTGNLDVEGDVSGNSSERGFISLTWTYPTTQQTGEYVCEINAIDDQGHNVVFTTSLEVGVTQPSTAELVSHISDLGKDKDDLLNKTDALFKQLKDIENMFQNCGQAPPKRHVEVGDIHSKDSWARSKVVYHKFQTPYSKPPVVKLGLDGLDHSNDANTRFDIQLVHVDENGFSMKCKTWADSYIYDMMVNWISLES